MPALRTKKWLKWVPALLWMGLIFGLSAHTGERSGRLSRSVMEWLDSLGIELISWFGEWALLVLRKFAHGFVYFVLACLFYFALEGRKKWIWAWGMATLYAASDEWHQTFVPGRGGAFTDVLIDSAGAALGVGCLLIFGLIWRKWRERKLNKVANARV